MIYVDTSVAMAYLLAEDRRPPDALWRETLVSSRLMEYEIWTRVHARRLTSSHGEHVRQLVGRLNLLELAPAVLSRALEPFPVPVRTLDGLHLASMEFLGRQGQRVLLATYDERMRVAAAKLGVDLYPL